MRSPQVVFSQTKTAFWSKYADIAQKYRFRGICFILALQWLELKEAGTSDADAILELKDPGRFLQLWNDFELQGKNAAKIKKLIEDELSNTETAISTYDTLIEGFEQGLTSQAPGSVRERIAQHEALRMARTRRQDQVAIQSGQQRQLKNMFASEEESDRVQGEIGTASEQTLRKMFSMTVQMAEVANLTVTSKGLLSNSLSWPAAGKSVGDFVAALATGTPGLFEIGFYGSGAHSVAAWADGNGRYAFFDPNYGVFTGDGNLNTLEADVANLLKDKYSKMNKVVVSWIKLG
ncbi:YopT-type cysteine protease domain-containing protein [Corallococcus aberystwythensis]|uniref:Peptidase C58 YopT-type domain-containing protein n=1 Tax=Corallococcus aberystwythensis TaxID=2316722 RepID=A0A3A8R2F5_9BACT|nr:YopT-type cysteine protease domain-containing protein [Corallococcus aberystwythensis]RKH72955.1 hypothetical protein D7W81_05035 [Corallococcus aberystwythensis]